MRRKRDNRPDPNSPPTGLTAWAQVVDASRLSERTAKQAEDYLRDYRRMNAIARHEIAFRLVSVIQTQVSPPPPAQIAPLDILATVVAARRRQLGIG
jgi:hypothetical protein